MQQAAVTNHVTSSVNTSKLIESMRAFFSTSKSVLAECMQNSRRAGASAVWFTMEDSALIITDDGCGITDFSKLVTMADSGWSQDIQEEDQPFGIGFYSVAFAAEKVQVESQGKQIIFNSDDLIHQRKIDIKTSNFIGGTRITLHGSKFTEAGLRYDLETFAKGFPIPVFYQGRELQRPHAKANLQGVVTPVGYVMLRGVHERSGIFNHREMLRGRVYCQGLPISAGRFTGGYRNEEETVIHIDHAKYLPRLPDRECFVDSDDVSEQLENIAKELWRDFFVDQKQKLSAKEFVSKYWRASQSAMCFDLMVDVPILPSCVLSRVEEKPILLDHGQQFRSYDVEAIRQEDVEKGKVTLYANVTCPESSLDFARLEWARKEKCIFVDVPELPQHHWAHGYIIDLDGETVTVEGHAGATESFMGHYVDGDITLVKDLALTVRGTTHKMTDSIIAVDNDNTDIDCSNVSFLVTDDGYTYGLGYVLRQASHYRDDNDSFNDADYSADSLEFENIVAVLRGEPPAETLKKVLEVGSARSKTNLRNRVDRKSVV